MTLGSGDGVPALFRSFIVYLFNCLLVKTTILAIDFWLNLWFIFFHLSFCTGECDLSQGWNLWKIPSCWGGQVGSLTLGLQALLLREKSRTSFPSMDFARGYVFW